MPSMYDLRRGSKYVGEGVVLGGFTQLYRALKRVEDGVHPELRKRLRVVGEIVKKRAEHLAPRQSGALASSIRISVTQAGASVYSRSEYGGVQNVGGGPHAGWSAKGPHVQRARASRYMFRAVDQTEAQVRRETEAVVDWLLKEFYRD